MDVKSGLCLCAGPRTLCRPSSSGARVYGRHVRSVGAGRIGFPRRIGQRRLPQIVCAEGDVSVADNHGTVSPSTSSSSGESEGVTESSTQEQSETGLKAAIEETMGEIAGMDLGSESGALESVVASADATSDATETPGESVAESNEDDGEEKNGIEGVTPTVHRELRDIPAPRDDLPFAVGDEVVGMVKWSGNRGSKISILDTEYEGFCQLRNSAVNLRDDVANDFDLHTHRPMKPGLIREFKVIAIPDDCQPGGRGPLLAARELDKNVNNQRLTQIMEVCRRDREVIQAHMIAINSGGVKCTLVGIPAFLPRSHCQKDSPAYMEDAEMQEKYVGKSVPIALVGIDRLKDRVVVSEKRAVESNAMRAIQPGALVRGSVRRLEEWGAFIGIDDTQMSCLLHISNISQATVNVIQDVFRVGDRVCAVVISMEEDFKRVSLSTADLEEVPGDMLVDKEKVYANAPAAVAQIQKEIDAQRALYLEQNDEDQ